MLDKIPRTEQETILRYNVENKSWEFYSSYPKHIRRWYDRITVESEVVDENNRVVMVSGIVNCAVTLFKRKKLTAEQKEELLKRLNKNKIKE